MRQVKTSRPRTQTVPPGGRLGDPFADSLDTAGLATITHGPYVESMPIAGLTVATIRRRFADRYNLPPDGLGMVDGHVVGDDTVIREGQLLTFMHRANLKGGKSPAPSSAPAIALENDRVVVTLPEGGQATASLAEVVPALVPRWFGDCIWPDGVKLVWEMTHGAIAVHQTPSRVHNLHWIAADSEEDFGRGTKYRRVRVALPYVVVLAVYRVARTGSLQLTGGNECFFANAPLSSMDDPLSYPALLNVSKMPGETGTVPLAWICSQHLDRSFEKIKHLGERSRTALVALVRHLFEDSFNRSSEHHEGASWFGETVKSRVDQRLASVEDWEKATTADPLFPTEVQWIPTGMTLKQVMQQIARYMKLDRSEKIGAADLARAVVNNQRRRKTA